MTQTGPIIRACADCEKEHGILNRGDCRKSHGQCRRHFMIFGVSSGIDQAELDAIAAKFGPDDWCPDLGEL
jgi:hypothetical protein